MGDSKNATAQATSSGFPKRRKGMSAVIFSTHFFRDGSGHIAFNKPLGRLHWLEPHSGLLLRQGPLVSPITPAFDAA